VALSKFLKVYVGELAWLAKPTWGRIAHPPRVLTQGGGVIA